MLIDTTPRLRRRHVLAWPCAGLLTGMPTLGRAADGAGALDAALQAIQRDAQLPLASLSVLVMRAGQIVYQRQWGDRYIDPTQPANNLPVTAETLFRIASVSKLFVGLGVMRLVEAGKLDLQADVSRWLGFQLRNPHFPEEPINLGMLLSHRSSLRDAGGYSFEPGFRMKDLFLPGGAHYGKGLCWAAPAADLDLRPGHHFSYCNLNYGVVGSVIESASGQRFDRFMQEQVLQPLGMSGGFDANALNDAQLAQVATLYRKAPTDVGPWDAQGPWHAQTDDFHGRRQPPLPGLEGYELGSNGTQFGPQGRLRTRVGDLGRAMRMLVNGGQIDGQPFLSPASIKTIQTERWRLDPQHRNGDSNEGVTPTPGPFQAWGLGQQHFIDVAQGGAGDRLRPQGGVHAWGHLGSAYGLLSALMVDPQRRNGIAYVISGTSADPDSVRGRYSSFSIWEERVQALLWNEAMSKT